MGKKLICSSCGYLGKPKKYTKGSIFLEIILWFLFIVPGLIYSLWRSTSAARFKGCPKCGSTEMIPVDSPRGRKLIKEYNY
ncbi:MAG TPA: hypothetical protein ENO18_01700 [Caldithrix sp.]|nr:hypothetical protein [Caldithrix sp.]